MNILLCDVQQASILTIDHKYCEPIRKQGIFIDTHVINRLAEVILQFSAYEGGKQEGGSNHGQKKILGNLNAHMETSTVLQNQLYDPEVFLVMQYPMGRLTFGQGC